MNMKSLIALLFAATSMLACRHMGGRIKGSGNIITEKRTVSNFTGIDNAGVISVEVKNGPELSVQVEADDNLQPYIFTEVKGSELIIDVRGKNSFTNTHMKVYVTAPVLNSISCSGVGDVKATSVLKDAEEIEFSNSSVGNIDAEVDAPAVKASTSGVGSVTLRGRCRTFDATVSGVGNINAFDLLAETVDASVSGVGGIEVHASKELKAGVSGAGDIRYRGGAHVESSVSGVGSVKKD